MLTSAADYEYVATTGVEAALVGNIIPVADNESRTPPIRYEDICYLCESTRVWTFDMLDSQLNPTYPTTGRTFVERIWALLYRLMSPSNIAGIAGCNCYLNDGITALPVQPRFNFIYVQPSKAYFVNYAPTLLLDYTAIMDTCPWQRQAAYIYLERERFDVNVPRLLYWILFQPCYQQVEAVLDTTTVSYDKTYSFCQRGMKSGNGQWHTSSGGVISLDTGPMVQRSDSYAYVEPAIQTGTSRGRPVFAYPMQLKWYSYYQTVSGQYESGYECCYDGATEDVYAYVDLRRDDVVDAYALVEYKCTNDNDYSGVGQNKIEKLTQYDGRRYYFKCFDYNFAKSLMEYHGADFTMIGTRSPSQSGNRFSTETWTHYIYVKYNHKYAQGISQQWQWQPE